MRNRRPFDRQSKDSLRVNNQIRAPRVLIIDEEGRKLGEFMPKDALVLAEERGFDLVEVSPHANPPVCRIMDYGKFKYDQAKRDKEKRENQTSTQVKEVRLRPKTDQHDFDVVLRKAKKFLEAGNKVKVVVRFRGREHAHRELGVRQCENLVLGLEEVGKIESPPRMEGRMMQMILAPK